MKNLQERKSMRERKPYVILSSSEYYIYACELYERISFSEDISDPQSYEDVISDKGYEHWIFIPCIKMEFGPLFNYHSL